jgi:hypothetical protein
MPVIANVGFNNKIVRACETLIQPVLDLLGGDQGEL